MRGSLARKPFLHPQHTADKVLERIHSDVCGPVETPSLGKHHYFVLFTDEYTRYTSGYFMHQKSDTFSCFLEFKSEAEKTTGEKIQSLRSDGGGEYQGPRFLDYLRTNGIRSECTTPYTPQENRLAERQNRTLMNKVLSMMSSVGAPKAFWVLACETAIYLRNRSPSTPLKRKTPYELWFGRMPAISHLRVWGCKVMYRIPKEHRKKLDYKARNWIFVGYCLTSKHYKIYDPESCRLITSRDVIFYENHGHWKSAVEISSGDRGNRGANHAEQYELGELFGSDLETDNEDPVATEGEGEGLGVIHVRPLAERIEEPVRRYRGGAPRIGTNRVRSGPTQLTRELKALPSNLGRAWELENQQENERGASEVDFLGMVEAGPQSIEEALRLPEKEMWRNAVEEEIANLERLKTWVVVERVPIGREAITSRLVLQKKLGSDGGHERYKARLVAHGFKQKPGIDFLHTYAPLVSLSTVRLVLSFAAAHEYEIHQLDVVAAFLESQIKEELYLQLPLGFEIVEGGSGKDTGGVAYTGS